MITTKAKVIAGIIKNIGLKKHGGFIKGKFLFTKNAKEKYLANNERKQIEGVECFGLSELDALLETEGKRKIAKSVLIKLRDEMAPQASILVEDQVHSFDNFSDLVLLPESKTAMYRLFKAIRNPGNDKVILSVYDVTAFDQKNALNTAEKEFKAIQKLQKLPFVPNIMDSFQQVKNYPGELYFFSYIDTEAPTLKQRAKDGQWAFEQRLDFSIHAFEALRDMHGFEKNPVLHRNLSPDTIRVNSNNRPIFTRFQFAKIDAGGTITGAVNPDFTHMKAYVAPEVQAGGLACCTSRSDVYGLAASIRNAFSANKTTNNPDVISLLDSALAENPDIRPDPQEVAEKLREIQSTLQASAEDTELDVVFWDEHVVKEFHERKYKIINKLGSGNVGVTFKVMETETDSQEEISGPYVAKVVTNESMGQQVVKTYARIRAQTGCAKLAGILEVAKKWQANEVTTLMQWIEGDSLYHVMGAVPRYLVQHGIIETHDSKEVEHQVLEWMQDVCEGLAELHQHNLVHGDVSPKNIIINGKNAVLTDFDLCAKKGTNALGGSAHYSSPQVDHRDAVDFSDDVYSLAASFFHVLFAEEPFTYDDKQDKQNGLNWQNIDIKAYPQLTKVFNKATDPKKKNRYPSAQAALQAIAELIAEQEEKPEPKKKEIPVAETTLSANEVPWLKNILQSYAASPMGNTETRGLDSDYAKDTYVETQLDEVVYRDIQAGKTRLVILCGNAGDGKTAFIQHLANKLGIGYHKSAKRIWQHTLPNGMEITANLDGAASYQDKTADVLLDAFFAPYMKKKWPTKKIGLLAINDGPLLAWLEQKSGYLADLLSDLVENQADNPDKRLYFIDLNARSLVGGYCKDKLEAAFYNTLVDKMLGDKKNWQPCITCTARHYCPVKHSVDTLFKQNKGQTVRYRLLRALQGVHQRGESHITTRELRALIAYVFFGYQYCDEIQGLDNDDITYYWDRAFNSSSKYRQGALLKEMEYFDPALEFHPRIDRYLLYQQAADNTHFKKLSLDSLRRKAYFEWPPEKIAEIGNSETALDIAHGTHLNKFMEVGKGDTQTMSAICTDLCHGIARLEDLPSQAFKPKMVPLRITPRTPTETIFWVYKPRERFSLTSPKSTQIKGMDYLNTYITLNYTFSNGHVDHLHIGLGLFNLLMELKEGYQLSDIRSDDVYANLSIFKQRLCQEEEKTIYAWSPISTDIYKLSIQSIDNIQKIAIQAVNE